MDCELARQILEDTGLDDAVAAHLDVCPSCRSEAEFGRAIAAAVASIPRVTAPEELVGRVMATIQPEPAAARALRRLPLLALRPWEVVWLAVLCCLVVVGIPFLLDGRGTLGAPALWSLLADWLDSVRVSGGELSPVTREWLRELIRSSGIVTSAVAAGSGLALSWVIGAAGFALSLVWLLSRHGEGGTPHAGEEAYA